MQNMAISNKPLIIIALFISFLLLIVADDHQHVNIYGDSAGKSTYVAKADCGAACTFRCSKSSRPRLCKRACGTCCQRCSCVPPGTSGNQQLCRCYYALITHGGRRKCP